MQFAQCGLQRDQASQSSLTHSSKSALLGMTHLQGVYAAMYHAGDVQDFCRKTGTFLESWPKAQAWPFHSGGGVWVIFKTTFYSSHSAAHHYLKNKGKKEKKKKDCSTQSSSDKPSSG